MEEENLTKYGFPESSNIIWIIFIAMLFGYYPKSEESFEIQLEKLVDAGISQDVIDGVKELKDKYEKDKDLLIKQLHENAVNI